VRAVGLPLLAVRRQMTFVAVSSSSEFAHVALIGGGQFAFVPLRGGGELAMGWQCLARSESKYPSMMPGPHPSA
jgi:hypothetical protein